MAIDTQSDLAWSGRFSVAHWIVILLSLVLTLGAWQYSRAQIESRVQARYETERDRVIELISVRMEKYEQALWAGVAAIYSHGETITRADWGKFAASLSIESRYPGINGIGVIQYLERPQVEGYLAEQRVDRPGFAIYPEQDLPFVMPITHIEPVDTNTQAVGLDVAHEANRRAALLKSRDGGTAQITGPIVLVQDAGNTPGFLFYVPYYRGGDPGTVEGRRARFLGAVYAPFVVRKLMQGVLAERRRQVSFSIRDGEDLIYDESTASGDLRDANPLFGETVMLDLYGRTWALDIRTNRAFRADNTYAQSWIILAGGLTIDVLLFALFWLMSSANHRATRHAEALHGALCRKTERLEESNAELEKIIYLASHDLKTPIRGIGGLTEMVIEDLEEHFAGNRAVPGMRDNLRMILDRVGRMESLARAVLDYAAVGSEESVQPAVDLGALLGETAMDLGLQPDQLHDEGAPATITADPLGFRRVIENLVGNAAKYHQGPERLVVSVRLEEIGERFRVTVRDNGPGIDRAHHARIFEMFQKFGTGRNVESSGIGLAIVKKTVETHGGTITLDSRPGAGAAFTFDWPRGPAPTLEMAA